MQSKLAKYSRGIVSALLVLVGVSVVWWQSFYTTPQRAFEDMLRNNLTTSSVTKKLTTQSGQTSAVQRVNLQLGSTNASRWTATIDAGSANASTESIGTPDAGYVRYTHIEPLKQTEEPIINVWAKSTDKSSELNNLFANGLLDMSSAPVPPIGNVSEPNRSKLLNFANTKKVFKPNYAKVTKSEINGRTVYNIPVDVALAPYIQLMQGFAHAYGLKNIDNLNAATYQYAKPVAITISVDKISHQMVRIIYPTTGFSETFSDYGIAHEVQLPAKTISEAELQSRVTEAR